MIPVRMFLEYLIIAELRQSQIPKWVRSLISGIFRPADYETFPKLVRGENITASLILHLTVLLTFGLLSPVLTIVIATAIIFECCFWKYVIIRFIKHHADSGEEDEVGEETDNVLLIHPVAARTVDDDSIILRSELVDFNLNDVWLSLYHARWRILYFSLFFVSLVLFDVAADKQGAIKALWVPVTVFVVALITRLGAERISVVLLAFTGDGDSAHPHFSGSISGNNIL
jgi:hypothetical protein